MKQMLGKHKTKRVAGILIEAIIAATLLMTATTALTRYVLSSRQLSVAGDQALAARLNTQNAIERLRVLSADDWEAKAQSVAKDLTDASGMSINIEVEPFQIGDRDALHATIECQIGSNPNVHAVNHAWKVIP